MTQAEQRLGFHIHDAGAWVATRLDETGSPNFGRMDRLGSVKAWQRYPFGEGVGGWNDEYATYPVDRWTGHYYAWNRFYSATWGRFSSPDPYVMSGGLTNPQGWNRYSYVANDPVNYNDPTGLERMQRTFLAPNERTARPIVHKNMAGISVPTNSDEPFNVGWPISDKRGDSVWLAEFGPDGMEVASETDTTSTQGRKPELDQDCVARVTTAVQKSYQQWRDTLPERVRSAMWRGALYGGLTGLILGGPGFPPGWAAGIVGSVTGMVGVAQWEIFIYTPMELAWNFFVTKEFNVDARVQRECNSQQSSRP